LSEVRRLQLHGCAAHWRTTCR